MKTTYYPEDDILEIHLNEKPVAREISYGWNLNISYAVDGSIREIVILEARESGLYPILTATERQAAQPVSRRSEVRRRGPEVRR